MKIRSMSMQFGETEEPDAREALTAEGFCTVTLIMRVSYSEARALAVGAAKREDVTVSIATQGDPKP